MVKLKISRLTHDVLDEDVALNMQRDIAIILSAQIDEQEEILEGSPDLRAKTSAAKIRHTIDKIVRDSIEETINIVVEKYMIDALYDDATEYLDMLIEQYAKQGTFDEMAEIK